MQRYNGQLINQFPNTISGNAAAGAQVTVRLKSSGALVTLYATDSLSGGTLPNPLTADAKGFYSFYAPDGVYTLDVSLSGTPQLEIQLQDVASLQAQFDGAVSNAGYIPVGTFAAGCTVSQANGVVSDGVSYWRWDGALPKTVTAGSSPVPTGVGGWVLTGGSVGSEFETALAAVGSTKVIAGFQARQLRLISSIKELIPATGVLMTVKGFYSGLTVGGGDFYYDPDIPKTSHDGGTIIAPEAINAWNGEYSGLEAYLNWSGSGTGCFVRKLDNSEIDLSWYGSTLTNLHPISLAKAQASSNKSTSIKGFFNNATVTGDLYIGNSFLGLRVDIVGTVNLNGYKFTVEAIGKEVRIGKITNTQDSVNSFILKDSYNCKIVVMEIDGSNYPVKLFSNKGSGCFNNEITVYRTRSYGAVGNTEVACWLITVDGGGFCNENHIRAGFMTGQRGIYFKKGTGQNAKFDGNKIIAPMFELIDYRGIEFQFCNYNHMYDARYEASHTPSDSWIYERSDCYQQQISGAQPIVANKLILLGEKTQYLAPLFSAEGDTSVGFRFCSLMHWRGIGEQEGFGFSQVMGDSSPRGTIAFKKNLGAAPFTQYAFWIKDYNDNIIGAGEVDPYGFIETGEQTTGDVILANNISWIMCRPPTNSTDTVSLIMPSSKQSEGREVTLYIPNTRYAQIEIKNAAGAVQLPTGTFDAEGIWKLFYRYAKWRAYFVGNNVKM